MAFLEDPRLRQRWNQIAHDAEAATENAAAGIWSFQHHYINPCFGSIVDSIDRCTTVCLGDPEERLRRRRERERTEYSFDFYDDWHEEEQGSGILGSWGGEDWDRLLAGTGSQRKHVGGETSEQPRRKRGMSYGTRGTRRKTSENDPTIIPSTQPIGFLSKLPWKVGGTLRYKPSAADLQEHPGKHDNTESEPLLGSIEDSGYGVVRMSRKRSGTTGSGDTSDSYRSRGDLFPSDGEGEEDAVPLDDDVTYDMIRKDDRSSGKTRSRSSKGKRPAGLFSGSRTVSRTTLGSTTSTESLQFDATPNSLPATPDVEHLPSLEDLEVEEERLRREEDEDLARKREDATNLAAEMGLTTEDTMLQTVSGPKSEVAEDEAYKPPLATHEGQGNGAVDRNRRQPDGPAEKKPARGGGGSSPGQKPFQAARLPHFG